MATEVAVARIAYVGANILTAQRLGHGMRQLVEGRS